MSADRELLELAAKAAGIPVTPDCHIPSGGMWLFNVDVDKVWNPLNDDGDALRLAVRLGLSIIQQHTFKGPDPVSAAAGFGADDFRLTSTPYDGNPLAATRRAIVRSASEIGRSMP